MGEDGGSGRMGGNYTRWLWALVAVVLLVILAAGSGWIGKIVAAGGHVLALYFAAWLLQFFFTPVVDFLSRRGMPRVLAVSCIYLALGVGVAGFLYLTIPGVVSQGQRLTAQLSNPRTYAGITGATSGVERLLEQRLHVPHGEIAQFTKNYSVSLQKGAVTAGTQLQRLINNGLTPTNVSNGASTVLNALNVLNTLSLNLLIILILAFYMMLDGHMLVRHALAYFPPAADEVMESIHQIINRKFGGYIRSQVILAASYGFLTYLISIGFNLRYSILISVVAAVAMLIPFLGAFIAIAPPLIAFVLVNVGAPTFPLVGFVILFLFLAVAQHVVINLLAPRVMSSAVGMHPLLVMLGLLLGAALGGLWGAIFGVPILGVILDVVDLVYRRAMAPRYGAYPRPVLGRGSAASREPDVPLAPPGVGKRWSAGVAEPRPLQRLVDLFARPVDRPTDGRDEAPPDGTPGRIRVARSRPHHGTRITVRSRRR